MRVAVVGGSGLVGRHVVEALVRMGAEASVVARSTGADSFSGTGLDAALAGAEVVVDVTTTAARTPDETRAFFRTSTRNLLAAGKRAGVRHHVLLSIAAEEAVPTNAHYAGKLAQEEEALAGEVPATIVRTTQFHEFAGQVAAWSAENGTAVIAPLLVRPVAARDVGGYLAEVALGEPQGRARDLAGPNNEDLFDMARRTLAARGDRTRLVPGFDGMFGTSMAGEVLLPGPDARTAPTSFDEWLLELAQPA